jgi:hypothetical protein
MPKLKLIKTLWGIEEPISPTLFESIRKEGYHGVEVIRLAWRQNNNNDNNNNNNEISSAHNNPNPLLVESLNKAGLEVVCQIHTAGGYLDSGGEYVYCGEYDVSAHKTSFQTQLRECANLLSQVKAGGFVNVHAGVDAWSSQEATDFLTYCLEEIRGVDFPVTFETHRQRLFGSPFQTRELLLQHIQQQDHQQQQQQQQQHIQLEGLKLNADLSHWYCACERVFDARQSRDAPWWPLLVDQVAQRCHYIHARLGWAQGPQMADPSAPECQQERDLQIDVWKRLVEIMNQRDGENGICYISPEYGPAPYLPLVPHTQEPVASLTGAVGYTKKILEAMFE